MTDEGDRLLKSLIQAEHERYQKKKVDIPVIIDAGSKAPWQSVMGAVNIAHRAGVTRVEFAMGAELK